MRAPAPLFVPTAGGGRYIEKFARRHDMRGRANFSAGSAASVWRAAEPVAFLLPAVTDINFREQDNFVAKLDTWGGGRCYNLLVKN